MSTSPTGWLVAALLLCACAEKVAPATMASEDAPNRADNTTLRDRDGDGLCDLTERDFDTDRDVADSDGDGLSDLVEVAYDLGPNESDYPSPERVVYLGGGSGAAIDFPVRVTVTGEGEGRTGTFEADGTVYDESSTADDFYVGASAVSAEPQDNVRGIDRTSGSFVSVVGETRLGFSLRFEHPPTEARECIRAYPFRYLVKTGLGEIENQDLYLLVVVPPDLQVDTGPWCGLEPCY